MDVKFYNLDEGEDGGLEEIIGDQGEYDVGSLMGARGPQENREYLVRWKHFPAEFDSWEPEEALRPFVKAMMDEADTKWPPTDLMEIADEPLPFRNDARTDPVDLTLADIEDIISLRDGRRGQDLEVKLWRRPGTRRIPVTQLPPDILNAPAVQRLLKGIQHKELTFTRVRRVGKAKSSATASPAPAATKAARTARARGRNRR